MKNQLSIHRKQIDKIDQSIINLLAKRFSIVKEIGKWKKKEGIKPLDQVRWEKVLTNRIERGKILNINSKLIKEIFKAIHKEALIIEERIKL